jgi:hypothetical protein
MLYPRQKNIGSLAVNRDAEGSTPESHPHAKLPTIHRTREPMTASLTTDRGLLSTARKSTTGVSLPAFASYFLDAGSIGLLAEYRCYELGIEILRELMHFAVSDAEDLTVVIVI